MLERSLVYILSNTEFFIFTYYKQLTCLKLYDADDFSWR